MVFRFREHAFFRRRVGLASPWCFHETWNISLVYTQRFGLRDIESGTRAGPGQLLLPSFSNSFCAGGLGAQL